VKLVDPDGKGDEEVTIKQFLGLLKSFADIFSVDIKIGIGVDLSVISPIKIDIFSHQTTFSSKKGREEKFTIGISAWFIGYSRTAPDIEGIPGINLLRYMGNSEMNVGPIIFNDKEKDNIDVVLSFGAQVLIGLKINISGKEVLNFLTKIGELQDALKQK